LELAGYLKCPICGGSALKARGLLPGEFAVFYAVRGFGFGAEAGAAEKLLN